MRFFVDRLLLLVGSLEVADGASAAPCGWRRAPARARRSARRRPRRRFRRPIGLGARLGSSRKLTSSSSSPSLCNRLDGDADRRPSCRRCLTRAPATTTRAALLARLLDRRSAVWCAGPRAPWPAGPGSASPASDLQIAVRRPEVIETLVLAVDQHRGRRIGLEQHPLGEIAESGAGAAPACASAAGGRDARPRRRPMRKVDFARPAAADVPIDPLLSWRSARSGRRASPTVSALPRKRMPPSRSAKWKSERPLPAPRGAGR